MINTAIRIASLLLIFAFGHAEAGVVVIGHRNLGKIDTKTMQKIYTGKVIEVGGIKVTPVNITPSALRERFLHSFLNQDDEKYTAYWTVRRYIGKGTPPRELDDSKAVVEFVRSTPGAIGYIDENDVSPDLNVISP